MQKQKGFTLIELIVVIVILGILAATALPRFANLQQDARAASANAALGSIMSAAALAHATFLARSTAANGTVTIEGQTATNHNGYPLASEIALLAGLGATGTNYTWAAAAGVLTAYPVNAPNTCTATYTEAPAVPANSPPTYSAPQVVANC